MAYRNPLSAQKNNIPSDGGEYDSGILFILEGQRVPLAGRKPMAGEYFALFRTIHLDYEVLTNER